MIDANTQRLLDQVTAEFAALPQVSAVVLSGSREGKFADNRSDIDLYVYADPDPDITWRTELARKFGYQARIDNHFWEPGDEWVATRTGSTVDIMYRSPAWITAQLDHVWLKHQASVGYSTCFVHNVLHSHPLYDKHNWYALLRSKVQQPYPEPLRQAIIAKNHPILRSVLASYVHQISLALSRADVVSVNHRISALLASYFDILFAVNRVSHPGEKRLVAYVLATCQKRPPNFQTQINELLIAISAPPPSNVLENLNDLLNGLDALLVAEGLIAR